MSDSAAFGILQRPIEVRGRLLEHFLAQQSRCNDPRIVSWLKLARLAGRLAALSAHRKCAIGYGVVSTDNLASIAVCTENSTPDVVVMKAAEDRA
jgi:hypothetical protein